MKIRDQWAWQEFSLLAECIYSPGGAEGWRTAEDGCFALWIGGDEDVL